jgi:MFS transporter, SP family, sugar:H+ symporter
MQFLNQRCAEGTHIMNQSPSGTKSAPNEIRVEPRALVPAGEGHATRHNIYVGWISAVAAIGGFLFGFDSGVVNGAVHALSVTFGTQAAATGFAVASVLLGCALGAFGAGT